MSGATAYKGPTAPVRALLIWTALCLLSIPAAADTIYLKSGKTVRAEKTWEEDGQIKANLFGATIGYDKADVEKVEKNQERPPADAISTAPREPPTPTIAPDFYQTDVRKVLNLLRDVSGLNFAVDPGVSGNVTLSIETPVPWTEVLDIVLKMNGLGKEQFGDKTLRIFKLPSG